MFSYYLNKSYQSITPLELSYSELNSITQHQIGLGDDIINRFQLSFANQKYQYLSEPVNA